MASPVDLTLESDDEDLQTAIRMSLSTSSAGGNGGSSASGDSNSRSKRASAADSSDHQRRGNGKRPRNECDPDASRPPLFRLLSTSASDQERNGSVGLRDLLSGEFQAALLSNYMMDMGLLVQAQPRLRCVPVVVVHGEKAGGEAHLRDQCAAIGNPGMKLYKPEIPQYGTHHTKMMILKFRTGVRVVVLTANFLSIDVTDKSQAVWYQEFPLRESEACDFEDVLVDYLDKIGGPAAEFGRTLRQYDFRAARVALVPSVPGTGRAKHKGEDAHRYGHMRVRSLLTRERESGSPAGLGQGGGGGGGGAKIVFQVSSLASRSPTPTFWLWELLESFMPQEEATKAGSSLAESAKSKLLAEHVRLLWPSVEAVRTSAKGWASGGSICCNTDNMYSGGYNRPDMAKYRQNEVTPELKPLLRKWKGNPATNRARDAPHIKTFLRYREVEVVGENGEKEARVDGNQVAWCLLTSSNLSTSALGFLDKKAATPQLTVRSFELGVMFLPSLLSRASDGVGDGGGKGGGEGAGAPGSAFTCTPGELGLTQRLPLTLLYECEPGKALPLDLLPLPYVLPAPCYDFTKNRDDAERPWVWDQPHPSLDHTGSSWPGVGRG